MSSVPYCLQVPIYLRSTVLSYAAVPAVPFDSASAYTEASHIQLFGPCDTDVFVHESTHSFDGTYNGLSSQPAYLEALYTDTCVPDEYAQTNNVECFAQDMVVFVYYLWNPSFFENSCMANQISYINTLPTPGVQIYKAAVGKRQSSS